MGRRGYLWSAFPMDGLCGDGWMLRFWRESRWRRRHSNNRAITSSRSSSTRIVVTAGQKSRRDEAKDAEAKDACLSLRFLSSLVRFTHYFTCSRASRFLHCSQRTIERTHSTLLSGPVAVGSGLGLSYFHVSRLAPSQLSIT